MGPLLLGCMLLALIVHTQCYNFGFNNSYTCHCLNDEKCDSVTGGCSNGCLRGWDGPSCQRENIALNYTSVSQSGINNNDPNLYGPQLVVDGYKDTNRDTHACSNTGNSPWAWWNIELQRYYNLWNLKIFHIDSKLQYSKGFSIHVDGILCFKHTGTSNPPAIYPIECNTVERARYVNISNNKPDDPNNSIALCEVEIYVCSPGTYGSECNKFCHCAPYNDGSYVCNLITGFCPIGCQKGWYGVGCDKSCSTINKYGVGCQKSCDDRQCSGNSTCDQVTGECIGDCKPGYLGIDCSQECPNGTYGDSCSKLCNNRQCEESQECHHITGNCTDGCTPGYIEDDCTVGCLTINKYGVGCENSCDDRQCSGDSPCNVITGECINGCNPGYLGIDCSQECSNGTYGDSCSKLCNNRQCQGSQECHHITGNCTGGCTIGYREDDCTVECSSGTYGDSCSKQCNNRQCQGSQECHHITGRCDDGCVPGYEAYDCTGNDDTGKTIVIFSFVVTILAILVFMFGAFSIIMYMKYKALMQTGNKL